MIAVVAVIFTGFVAFGRALRRRENQAVVISGLVVLAVGVVFYSLHEGWSVIDSAYFCVVTLTTVGYGDKVPSTNVSKIFTMGYVVAGLGVMGAMINAIVQQASERLRERQSTTDENA